MNNINSRIPSFYKLSIKKRLEVIQQSCSLDNDEVEKFNAASQALGETANHLVENAIGTYNIPLGIATNLLVDNQQVLVPMATEESSVIAAVCNGAKQCFESGGVYTSKSDNLMIAQIQVMDLSTPYSAKNKIYNFINEIKSICNECDPFLVSIGGGFRGIEVRLLDDLKDQIIIHLIIDTKDAMGANTVNSMAEVLAPSIEKWTDGTVGLKILTNLADQRIVRASAVWYSKSIGGDEVVDAVIKAGVFAKADPYRAATHNKGIMNGVSAVVMATGNDTRAVESGAHAYASRLGHYTSLTHWEKNKNGDLIGSIELPLAVGIVGGATKIHPTAQMALKIMQVNDASRLAGIIASVGLVQNFSAMKALATEGIQRGHMTLHASNVAISAGAKGEEISKVAEQLVLSKKINEIFALQLLKDIRQNNSSKK